MCDDPDDAALREGARRFDAGAWFEAHEAWEEAWRGAAGGRRALLQGLILAAAALLKHELGVDGGAARLWKRGRAHLREAASDGGRAGGLDVGAFAAAMDAALAGRAAPPRLADHLPGPASVSGPVAAGTPPVRRAP